MDFSPIMFAIQRNPWRSWLAYLQWVFGDARRVVENPDETGQMKGSPSPRNQQARFPFAPAGAATFWARWASPGCSGRGTRTRWWRRWSSPWRATAWGPFAWRTGTSAATPSPTGRTRTTFWMTSPPSAWSGSRTPSGQRWVAKQYKVFFRVFTENLLIIMNFKEPFKVPAVEDFCPCRMQYRSSKNQLY